MVYPDAHGLVESAMSNFYPQNSDNYLLFIGEKENNRDYMEALLMPAYNNPTSSAISQNCNSAILY